MAAQVIRDLGSVGNRWQPDTHPHVEMSDLTRAVLNRNIPLVRTLSRQIRSVNAPSPVFDDVKGVVRWETPLITSSRLGYLEIVMVLADCGAHVDQSDATVGKSPLHWACARGHIGVAKFLIVRGANIDKTDFYMETPIVEALGQKNFELVEMLVDRGAALRGTLNYDRDNALLFSLLIHEFVIARFLLQRGAHVRCVNREGEDTLSAALASTQPAESVWDMVQLLLLAGVPVLAKHQAIMARRPDLRDLVDHLVARSRTPNSLKNICRNLIRNIMSELSGHTSIKSRLELLPLPPVAIKMLCYEII